MSVEALLKELEAVTDLGVDWNIMTAERAGSGRKRRDGERGKSVELLDFERLCGDAAAVYDRRDTDDLAPRVADCFDDLSHSTTSREDILNDEYALALDVFTETALDDELVAVLVSEYTLAIRFEESAHVMRRPRREHDSGGGRTDHRFNARVLERAREISGDLEDLLDVRCDPVLVHVLAAVKTALQDEVPLENRADRTQTMQDFRLAQHVVALCEDADRNVPKIACVVK